MKMKSKELDELVDEIVNSYIKGQGDIDYIKYRIASFVVDAQSCPEIITECLKVVRECDSP